MNIAEYIYEHKKELKNINFAQCKTAIYNSLQFNTNVLKIKDVYNPKTLSDKIRYISAFGILDELKSICADKILLHTFSKFVLGKDICIPILKVFKDKNDINVDELPNKFVIKANHASGLNLIVKDKLKTSNQKIQNATKNWLTTDFSTVVHETHYARIIPKLYVEQYMNNGKAVALTDYKFLCFNGIPMFCQIINDRHTALQRLNYYNMKFEFLDICRNDFQNNINKKDTKPAKWNEMIMLAVKFSQYFDFVRVDLYEIDGKVYLGELTFTPGAGKFTYKNPNDNIRLGNMLQLTNLHQKFYDLQQQLQKQ